MANLQHPASLNPLRQFVQACSILRNTTRARNPAWYQSALELNSQLHIRTDGSQLSTFYFDFKQNQWSAGPTLNEEILNDPAKLEALIADILRYVRSTGATSLGVILHIADEFATTELKPELDNPASLNDLRDTAIDDPGSVLEDSSIQADQHSWRVIPYSAAGSEVIATAVTVTRQYAPLFEAFRHAGVVANFPFITHALSAPLVAIMGLSQALIPTPGKCFVAILQYPWFTALAFFNEHADLRLIRTLQHRGIRRPTNFRNALTTTNASLEFVDPDLFLLPLGQNVDTTLEASLRVTFSSSRVETVELPQSETTPAWCPEPLITSMSAVELTAPSNTFTILRDEKWALQDFLPTPKEIVEIYPDRSEMRLLRSLSLARVAIISITILAVAYLVVGIFDILRRPEWTFDSMQVNAISSRLAKLNGEKLKAEHWNNLLEDRAKAWVAMEALTRMFPENGGMLVKTYSHTSKPDITPGKKKIGFIREWKITGFARDEALEYLSNLNTRNGINSHFSEVSRITANSSYNPTIGNRNITVNVKTQENQMFKPVPLEEAIVSDDSTYPFTFDLTIIQRFEATDPLAVTVPTPKAP